MDFQNAEIKLGRLPLFRLVGDFRGQLFPFFREQVLRIDAISLQPYVLFC